MSAKAMYRAGAEMHREAMRKLAAEVSARVDALPIFSPPTFHGPQFIDADRLWGSLKRQCCTSPETAVRCVMVSREDFDRAVVSYGT